MKPIIGITPTPTLDKLGHGTFRRYALSDNYTRAVEAAGGIPIILAPQHGNIEPLVSMVDGLIFSGGGDIDPTRYGDSETHEKTDGIDELRDEFELALLRSAIDHDKPVLCICRGIQVANVACGGTLIQDIAAQHSTEIQHRQHELGKKPADPSHPVAIESGSLLAQVYGSEAITTNSFHHQSLREVSDELRVIARAQDGVIEAVERPESDWFLCVQWHPEMMFAEHDEHLKPFAALVEAATTAKTKKSAEPVAD